MRSMRLISLSFACFSLLLAGAALGQDRKSAEASKWLTRIAASARELTYSGTFVHQFGRRMETMRISHLFDDKGELEKLETLDGPPREIVRENETVHCYFPESRVVKLEQGRARRYFPALIGESAEKLNANYEVRLEAIERVAGYDCQVLWLQPKDQLRFAHRLCAEIKSGLLLKAAIEAQGRVGLMLNVRRVDLATILSLLPALQRPTISGLSDDEWVAVNTIIEERTVRDLIPKLKAARAQGIVEYPLNKIVL